MSKPGQILFTMPPELTDMGRLPVRVRSRDGALVGSGLTATAIDLPASRYRVSVVMPDGEERFAPDLIALKAGQMAEVGLYGLMSPELAEAAPEEAMAGAEPPEAEYKSAEPPPVAEAPPEPLASPEAQLADMALAAAAALPDSNGVEMRIWRGHWLGDWTDPKEALAQGLGESVWLDPVRPTEWAGQDGIDQFFVYRHVRDDVSMIRMTIVPWDQCIVCIGDEHLPRIEATLREGVDPPTLRYRSVDDSETNALLGFLDAGVLGDMQQVSAGFIDQGREAMLASRVSLLRGLLGAYISLRANSIEKLGDWLEGFAEQAPGIPDIHALQVELYARLGQHDRAVRALVAAMSDDCPWFRAGLSYLLERLRLYLDLDADTRASLPLSEAEWQSFARAKARIEALAPYLITSQTFATFDIPE